MALDTIPARSLNPLPTRQDHIDDHERYRTMANSAIYSPDWSSLQAAIDKAASLKRPLVIAPGTYNLTSPMLQDKLTGLHVFAYNANFNASADMASILDQRDCRNCSWHGGTFSVPTGRIVDNAIYTYTNTDQSIRNTFEDVMVQGEYTVGLRVGKQGIGGLSCDHHVFSKMEFVGQRKTGQIGVWVGDGISANCLNHVFDNLKCNQHETHIKVDHTNAYFTNVFLDAATTDFYVDNTLCTIRNVRSEDSTRFLSTAGPASYLSNITIQDVWWNGEMIAADGEWIQHRSSGYMKLSNVKCINAAHPPVIRSLSPAALIIKIDGLSTIQTAQNAFVHDSNTIIKGDYIQHDSNIAVVSITSL